MVRVIGLVVEMLVLGSLILAQDAAAQDQDGQAPPTTRAPAFHNRRP